MRQPAFFSLARASTSPGYRYFFETIKRKFHIVQSPSCSSRLRSLIISLQGPDRRENNLKKENKKWRVGKIQSCQPIILIQSTECRLFVRTTGTTKDCLSCHGYHKAVGQSKGKRHIKNFNGHHIQPSPFKLFIVLISVIYYIGFFLLVNTILQIYWFTQNISTEIWYFIDWII